MMKNVRVGFTLAEVLTTLMVIGVVAAMTIPTLLNATTDQQQRVAYKKAMSVLSQGIQLMTAREEECTVQDGHELAVCMQNVISGTLYQWNSTDEIVAATGNNGNIIVTPDGMSYAFYYNNTNKDANAGVDRSLDDICGRASNDANNDGMFGNAVDDWSGANSRCVVIVDLNGPAKGSHSFSTTAGDQAGGEGVMAHHAIVAADLQGSDQAALLLTGGGVRPIWNDNEDADGRVNRGYRYMYGDNADPDPQAAAANNNAAAN